MNLTELIETLTIAKDNLGELPVTMGWTKDGRPGPVVALKIYDDHVELRCEREVG